MEINGYKVKDHQVDACVRRMKGSRFSAQDIFAIALDAGVPEPGIRGGRDSVAFKFVERLLTDHRKRGLIKPAGTACWEWRSSSRSAKA